MNLINKKQIFRVFGFYVAFMVFGGLSVNYFVGEEKVKLPTLQTVVKSIKVLHHVDQVFLATDCDFVIQSEDLTGLKSITRKRRVSPADQVVTVPKTAFASINAKQPKASAVDFVGGLLTEEKRKEIRLKITDISKLHLGKPYRHGTRGPNSFDCSGFTSYIMKNFGIVLSPSSRTQAMQGKPVELSDAKTGDLLFFSAYGKRGIVTHVALILENSPQGIIVIHACTSRLGIRIDNVSKSSYWKKKILYARDVISADSRSVAQK